MLNWIASPDSQTHCDKRLRKEISEEKNQSIRIMLQSFYNGYGQIYARRFSSVGSHQISASSLKSQQISALSVKSSLFFQAGDSVLLVTNLRPHPPRFCPLS